jgi:hypothetical protein
MTCLISHLNEEMHADMNDFMSYWQRIQFKLNVLFYNIRGDVGVIVNGIYWDVN